MSFENTVEKELKKQLKIMARKKHYWALYRILDYVFDGLHEGQMALEALEKVDQETRESIPAEVNQEMRFKYYRSVTALFAITQSLQSYKQAFGEYPEWIKFTPWGREGEASIEKAMKHYEAQMENVRKTLSKDRVGDKFLALVFGEKFIAAAEKVKLKGEV